VLQIKEKLAFLPVRVMVIIVPNTAQKGRKYEVDGKAQTDWFHAAVHR